MLFAAHSCLSLHVAGRTARCASQALLLRAHHEHAHHWQLGQDNQVLGLQVGQDEGAMRGKCMLASLDWTVIHVMLWRQDAGFHCGD